ncbi:MAG: VOC family protein [Pseudomonadota bacterium]
MKTQPGEIHWCELMTRDPKAAESYFAAVAGWQSRAIAMGEQTSPYLLCEANGHPVAGIMDISDAENDDLDAGWTTFVHVEDVDRVCARTIELGGHVVRKPTDIDLAGRVAVVTDPTGARIGLITPNDG